MISKAISAWKLSYRAFLESSREPRDKGKKGRKRGSVLVSTSLWGAAKSCLVDIKVYFS